MAADLGAATTDHLEYGDSGITEALRDAGVIAVLHPGADMHLGLSHFAPAGEMIQAGLAIVLATDFNPGSSPPPNMQLILSLACPPVNLTPAAALTAGTINAACSLNRGDQIGFIELGKQANLALFSCDDYREIPYFCGLNQVNRVIKKGVVVHTKSLA